MSQKHVLYMETIVCAVSTARHQHVSEACTVCGDHTVCSCRHSKTSAWVKSMYCIWRLLCAAVSTARHQHVSEACTMCGDHTVCSCRHSKSEACTVYRDSTVCSCRHSKSQPWFRSMYSIWRLLCAAVGTASYQHESQACTVYGDYCVQL